MPSLRQFFSHRLIWLALLVSLGIGALFARAIWTIRSDEWNYAKRTNANLVQTLSQGLVWSMDSFDSSLVGVVNEVSRPEVWSLPPDLRARVVFDNSLRVNAYGDILVLDAQGDVILDSGSTEHRKTNLADRDYFTAFSADGHRGLFIGKPVPSRLSGMSILPISRAYYHPDGRLQGVVVGAIRLSYFNEMFAALDLGPSSGVNLFRNDGVVISRFPYGDVDVGKSLAGTPNMLRFQKDRFGDFAGTAALDGVERLYSFRQIGGYPLILNVAQSTDNILLHWYRSALVLGGFSTLLMAGCIGLAFLFTRELGRRQKVSAQLREAEHNVRTILNNMPSMIGYWDADLINRFANDAYVDWFGVTPERLRSMHIRDLMGPELFARNEPFLRRALAGEPQLFERTLVNTRGESRHTMASYLPDVEDGVVRGIFVQVTDISERKRMEEELFEEKERARLTLQAIGDAVICADVGGHVTYLNPVAEKLTGWQAFDASGRNVDDVATLQKSDDGRAFTSPLRIAMTTGSAAAVQRGVIFNQRTGQRFDVEATASPITDRHGRITGAVAVLRDVTDAVAMAERMAHLAQYDALTDLPNRVLLHDRAELGIAQARRDGRTLAVMYVDLDGFKQVNDRLGHDTGDALLVQFAQRLKAAVRATDTVCRQGGDEFVVLLPGLDGADAACAVARKILAACDAAFDLGSESMCVGLSGGIALYPQHGDTFDVLSRHADEAMYAAKRGGRGRFMLYAGPDAEAQTLLPASAAADAGPQAAEGA